MESEDGASLIRNNYRRKVSSTFVSQRRPRATGNAVVAGRNSIGGGGTVARKPGGPGDIRGTAIHPDFVLLPGIPAQLTRDARDREAKLDVSQARNLPAATITIGETTNNAVDNTPTIPTAFGAEEPTYCINTNVTNLNNTPEDDDENDNGVPDDEEQQEGFGWQCVEGTCTRVEIDDATAGSTIYPDKASCVASGCEITITYNCIDDVCTEVVGDGGQYATLAECQQQCEPPQEPAVPGQCECVVYRIEGGEETLTNRVLGTNATRAMFPSPVFAYGPVSQVFGFNPLTTNQGVPGFGQLRLTYRGTSSGECQTSEVTLLVSVPTTNSIFTDFTQPTITRVDGMPDDCPLAPTN